MSYFSRLGLSLIVRHLVYFWCTYRCAICSVVARNNDILKQLVFEAKREYEKDAEHRIHIFLGDM